MLIVFIATIVITIWIYAVNLYCCYISYDSPFINTIIYKNKLKSINYIFFYFFGCVYNIYILYLLYKEKLENRLKFSKSCENQLKYKGLANMNSLAFFIFFFAVIAIKVAINLSKRSGLFFTPITYKFWFKFHLFLSYKLLV